MKSRECDNLKSNLTNFIVYHDGLCSFKRLGDELRCLGCPNIISDAFRIIKWKTIFSFKKKSFGKKSAFKWIDFTPFKSDPVPLCLSCMILGF